MKKELIVAKKEFNDHLTSKRFLVILGALILLSIVGIISGITEYNSQLDDYRANMQGASQIMMGPQQTQMPTVLLVFQSINDYFLIIGLALAVSMGFDVISREKEDGSLKSLLTHPVYRDSIINGKTIGSVSMLTVVLAAMFLMTIAFMLFCGLVPTGDDMVRIGMYFVMTLLYCVTFFSISLVMSTWAKNSAMSVAYTLGVLLFVVLLPMLSFNIVGLAMGEEPDMLVVSTDAQSANSQDIRINSGNPGNSTRQMMTISPEYTSYWETRNQITGIINMISPVNNFQCISEVLLEKLKSPISTIAGSNVRVNFQTYGRLPSSEIYATDSLSSVIVNIISLIVISIVALAASYVKFMRADVR
ncbi:ABC transporter [Methanocella sp. CWC-04]|uniref:ABC transporter n=1 Tax=Methanooceanicella nereidis TaxID=2052831 RepID=A0AAP2RHG5_9EURY|nr:ABC transporter permease subunit [Methanocella sp. CWC-04]MCD1296335.1 ABC transporter [Methanocella sp. CWC-04]